MSTDEPAEVCSKPAMEAKPLSLVKAYYFAAFCFMATHFRYLTLYFKAEGLTATEIGMMWSITRVIGMVSTILWPPLADQTKRARSMVLLALTSGAVTFCALAIPLPHTASRFWPRALALWSFHVCYGPVSSLLDALAISACAQDSERWGKARVYGAVGWGLMHLTLGPLIDRNGFSVLFAAFIVCDAAFFFIVRGLPESCGQVKKDVTFRAIFDIFLRNRLFFINMIALGAGFSMVEGMLFLLLKELDASTLLCGMAVVVTVVFELPIFHYAGTLLNKLGAKRMIVLGQAAWVVRAIFYSVMPAAWTVLLIEPLHGVTYALVWTASTQYVKDPAVSGHGFEASGQGLLQLCFFDLGGLLGLSIGGVLFDTVGSHSAYALFAIVILAMGLIYACFGHAGEARRYESFDSSTETPSSIGRSSTSSEFDKPADDERVIVHLDADSCMKVGNDCGDLARHRNEALQGC